MDPTEDTIVVPRENDIMNEKVLDDSQNVLVYLFASWASLLFHLSTA
jgi:hypothetical protein